MTLRSHSKWIFVEKKISKNLIFQNFSTSVYPTRKDGFGEFFKSQQLQIQNKRSTNHHKNFQAPSTRLRVLRSQTVCQTDQQNVLYGEKSARTPEYQVIFDENSTLVLNYLRKAMRIEEGLLFFINISNFMFSSAEYCNYRP